MSNATLTTHPANERKSICQSSKLSWRRWPRPSRVISPRNASRKDCSAVRGIKNSRNETPARRNDIGRRVCLTLAELASRKEPSTGAQSHPIQNSPLSAKPPYEAPLMAILHKTPSSTTGGGLKASPVVTRRCSSPPVTIFTLQRSGPEVQLRSLLEGYESAVNEPCRVWENAHPVAKHILTVKEELN
jgi:hypothetical protein